MLVLARDEEEEIIVTVPPTKGPRRMAIKLIRASNGRAKIGIEAADDVEVNRAEVQAKIDRRRVEPLDKRVG